MQRWALTHPELGEREVLEGTETELREVDPGWDKPASQTADAASELEVADEDGHGDSEGSSEDAGASADAEEDAAKATAESLTILADWLASFADHLPGPLRGFRPRLHELARRARQSIETYVLVRRDGVVLARMAVNDGGIWLRQVGEPPVAAKPGQVTRPSFMVGKPKLRFETTGLREIVAVYYMGEDGTVSFPPPPGGFAEQRMREIEASPAKRVLYPVLGGFAKAGSALAWLVVLAVGSAVFGPLKQVIRDAVFSSVRAFFAWLLAPIRWVAERLGELVPDLPEWVERVMEYRKFWLPILIGIVIGVGAWRRSCRARSQKPGWSGQDGIDNGDARDQNGD